MAAVTGPCPGGSGTATANLAAGRTADPGVGRTAAARHPGSRR
jgi:hypothetical protein